MNEPGFGRLIERAQWLGELDRRLRQSLPASLAEHCRLGNVREGRLVFLADSAVWSTKLRLHADDILAVARDLDLPAAILTVKIVCTQPVDRRSKPCLPLSEAARASLRAAAADISDPALRDQLLQLSNVE